MKETDLKEELTLLIQRVGSGYCCLSLKTKTDNIRLLQRIMEQTAYLPEDTSLKERCFIILNGDALRTCTYGNIKKFNSIDKGYRFCAADCQCRREEQSRKMLKHHSELDPEVMAERVTKARRTLFLEHGVENPMHVPEFKNNLEKTNLERFGVPYPASDPGVQDKMRRTMIDKYGCHAAAAPEVKDKIKATNRERHGADNCMHIARQAFLDQNGGLNPFCVPEIAEKARQSMIAKYGVEKPLQNPDILNKMIEQTREKYGVDSVLMLPQFQAKSTSKIGTHWLNSLGVTQREYYIYYDGGYLKIDGYDPATNTVYEFYGDYHHGNPKKFAADMIHRNGKPMGLLHEATMLRDELIRQLGYNLVVMWESDWKAERRCAVKQ
jgi:hypothetical protein